MFSGVGSKPEMLDDLDDPVGPENDRYIKMAIEFAVANDGILIAAWGVPKGGARIRRMAIEREALLSKMGNWKALRITKAGHPQHPLYLPYGLEPVPWQRS